MPKSKIVPAKKLLRQSHKNHEVEIRHQIGSRPKIQIGKQKQSFQDLSCDTTLKTMNTSLKFYQKILEKNKKINIF